MLCATLRLDDCHCGLRRWRKIGSRNAVEVRAICEQSSAKPNSRLHKRFSFICWSYQHSSCCSIAALQHCSIAIMHRNTHAIYHTSRVQIRINGLDAAVELDAVHVHLYPSITSRMRAAHNCTSGARAMGVQCAINYVLRMCLRTVAELFVHRKCADLPLLPLLQCARP